MNLAGKTEILDAAVSQLGYVFMSRQYRVI